MKWAVWCLLTVLFQSITTRAEPLRDGECCPKACSCTRASVFCHARRLTTLPVELLTCLPASINKLTLNGNGLTEIRSSPFVRLTNLTVLYLHGNQIHHIDKEAFKGLKLLEVLTFHANQLSDLPVGLFDHTPSMLRLYLYGNLINQLRPGYFSSLGRLTRLSLLNNKLKTIPQNAFKGLFALQDLYLQQNEISNLQIGSFQNLTNLRELLLSYNDLRRLGLGVFYGMVKLEKLFLDHNKISEINSMTFADVTTLKEVRFSHNLLRKISVFSFTHLTYLQNLDLSYNKIAEIERGAFYRQELLMMLNLRSNMLKHINSNIFLNLAFLKKLYLHDNLIEYLPPGAFDATESLEELVLYDNKLRNISCGTFKGLHKLRMLNLGANQIEWIADGAFSELKSLVFLYLYFNYLSVFTKDTFAGLSRLNFLQVQCNRVEYVEEGAFVDLNNLLGLEFVNPMCSSRLPCDCNSVWLQDWIRERKDKSEHRFSSIVYCISQKSNQSQMNILDLNKELFTCDLPTISVQRSAEVVKVGGSIILSCQSSPASRYRWSKAGKPYTTSSAEKCVPSSGQLELKDVKQEDGGQYVCLGTTKNWLVANCIDVVVSVSPFVTQPMEDEYLRGPGKTARFTCAVDGTPKPRILWFKNEKEIKKSEKFVKVGKSLFILDAGQEDAGAYQCVARNELGEEVKQEASLVIGRQNTCSRACSNGGTCVAVQFGCSCRSGFTGDFCEIDTGIEPTVSGMEPMLSGMMPTISGMGPEISGTDMSGLEPEVSGTDMSGLEPSTVSPTLVTPVTPGTTRVPTRTVVLDGTLPTNNEIDNTVPAKNNDNVPVAKLVEAGNGDKASDSTAKGKVSTSESRAGSQRMNTQPDYRRRRGVERAASINA